MSSGVLSYSWKKRAYASFSRSFQPSAENFPLAANNAQIAPEETTNTEIGGKFDFLGGAVSATFDAYRPDCPRSARASRRGGST